MKQFEFNHQRKMWDTHRAFHSTQGPFTEFETGELMVHYLPRPDGRQVYQKYGIQLVGTSDRDCPKLYLDKACTQEVLTAWVTQRGQQLIAVDEEQKVAVALRTGWSNKKELMQFLPSHVHNARALWTGPNRLPVPLAQITVSQPDPTVKKGIKDKVDTVRTAVTAAARIKGLPTIWGNDKLTAKPEWEDMEVEDIVAHVCSDDLWMRMVATNGFTYPRADTKHDFLYIK